MILLLFFVLIIVVLSNRDSVLAVYLTITFLFPGYVRIYPIPVSLQLAFIAFFFVFTLVFKNSLDHYRNIKYVSFFVIYLIFSKIIFAFLGTFMPFDKQLDINATLMSIVILLCWINTNNRSFDLLKLVLPKVLFIFMIYGMLTSILSTNPYFGIISQFMEKGDTFVEVAERYSNEVRGGLTGRISVVTYNPLRYAILVDILSFFVLYLYMESKEKKYLLLLVLMFVNVFLAGSRGPLVALMAPILFFLFLKLDNQNKLMMIGGGMIVLILVFSLPIFDSYTSYIKSFIFIFDESYSDAAGIKGSSVSGRFEQLEGSILLVLSSFDIKTILFGYGQGYTNYYLSNYGYSTSVLGFESAIFAILVNHGFVGLLVFFVAKYIFLTLILYLCRKGNLLSKNALFILRSMLVCNLLYSTLVGPVYEDLFYVVFFMLIKISSIKQEFRLKLFCLINLKLKNKEKEQVLSCIKE